MPAGDLTNICELRGRAPEGKGCTNKVAYPNGVRHCAKTQRTRGNCDTVDVDTLSAT